MNSSAGAVPVDWRGEGVAVADRYRGMAERELRGVSPCYEQLCLAVAADDTLCALIGALPPPKRQPNLLLAAARHLGAPTEHPAAFVAWTAERWDEVRAVMLRRRTQTNEAGRQAALLPVLADLPQPLALLEVGTSAGLCLYPDRYRYRYHHRDGVHEVGAGPVLDCEISGPVPPPDRVPTVIRRTGLDLNPLDVTDPDDVAWLSSLIWPEQRHRAERLADAARIAAADPPQLVAGDLLADVGALVAGAPDDATLVVFHTAVLAYVPAAGRSAFTAMMLDMCATRPGTVWLSNEAPGVIAGTEIARAHDLHPRRFVLSRDGIPVALPAPHGDRLEWLP